MSSKEFFKEVRVLKEAVKYQENAIVSKTVVSAGNNSVTLFAFDAGQEIAAHSAPVDALVQNVEGEVEIVISGESFILKEGDIIVMPKGEPHVLYAKTQFKMMLVKI